MDSLDIPDETELDLPTKAFKCFFSAYKSICFIFCRGMKSSCFHLCDEVTSRNEEVYIRIQGMDF